MKRAWDSFLFCDELDLLEARFIELDSAVYRHVLIEAPLTFQGSHKPLFYAENKERFAPWQDKIIHVIAELPEGNIRSHGLHPAWDREHTSREAIWRGLDGFHDDDIFLLSDVDEIPRPEITEKAPGHVLAMRNHLTAVNLIEPGWHRGTMATLGKPTETMQSLRERRSSPDTPVLQDPFGWVIDAGWHFSWMGGPDVMRAKAHAFAHWEAAAAFDEHAERIYRKRINPASGINHLLEVTVDESFPTYMQEHRGPASWYWPGA
jgi:glycosyl transferase family 17